MRRTVRVPVSLATFVDLFLVAGDRPGYAVRSQIPAGVRVLMARVDNDRQELVVTLEHETFDVVPRGSPAPERLVELVLKDAGSPSG